MSSSPQSKGFFKSELGLRIVSAIVLLIIILWVSWIGGVTFAIVSVLISALMFYEWQSIVRKTPFDGTEALLTIGFAGILVCSLFGGLVYALALFLLLGLALELLSSGSEKEDVRWIGLGALYCAIPAVCFPLIRDYAGFFLLLFVFMVVWVTDIAAYFVGKRFGGAKLFPAVSPKKTWSGALGGFVGACIMGLIFALFVEGFVPLWSIVAAGLLSIVSQVGDLFESWIKRLFDVKDSSHLIPGHGGFLDRLDGLVAAVVPVAVIVALNIG